VKQPHAYRLVALALLLELGHAPELAEGGGALEQPAQGSVLLYVALREDDADLWVEPAREQPRSGFERASADLSRVVFDRERVQVDDAETESALCWSATHWRRRRSSCRCAARRTIALQRTPVPSRAGYWASPQGREFLGHRVSDRSPRPAGNLPRVGYKVHTDIFEGPFDLLLRLITEQRVDLYEVALADIVERLPG